jgi:hypothetical protein
MTDEQTGSFSSLLSHTDRSRLREIVKKTHLKFYPTSKLTNFECDKFIDTIGPEVMLPMLKKAVDGNLIG